MNLAGLEAELLRRSFADFAARYWPVVTGAPMQPNKATTAVCAVLQRVADGELHRVLIALPSGVGKSTLLCLYAAWRLARNPGHRSIHMMHSSSLADTESRRVRRLVESDEFRALFPAVALRADESTVAAWATTQNGRYFSVGRDTALLGRRALEAVLDDPADVADRFSPAAKQALWTWFEESLMTRLDGDLAPVVVVHQRTSIDDLIGKLADQRDQHGNRIWTLLALPAEDDAGELLAPTILTRAKLDELKTRNPRVYRAMFLQAPDADDGSAIPRRAWRFHVPDGGNPRAARPDGCASPDELPTIATPTKFSRIVVSVDPTFGGTKTANDFCAIHAWGETAAGAFLLDRWHRKAKQLEQRTALKELIARVESTYGRVTKVLIEKTAGGAGLIEELEAEGMRNIEPIIPTGGKAERLEHVTPTIERGFAFLMLGMHGLAELVEECAGAAAHDDDPDAVQIALHWLNTTKRPDARVRMQALGRAWLPPAGPDGRVDWSRRAPRVAQPPDTDESRAAANAAHLERMLDIERRMQGSSTSISDGERAELVRWLVRKAG